MFSRKSKKHEIFKEFLEEHRDGLYRLAVNMIWDEASAEDALHDAIVAAYQAFDRFEEGTNFKAWIYKFLVNTIFNYNTKIKNSLEIEVDPNEIDVIGELENEMIYDSILEDINGFIEKIDDKIKDALNMLKPAERMVFLLRSVDGFSYREISDLLKIPVGTVGSHLARARKELRRQLSVYAKESGFTVRRREHD